MMRDDGWRLLSVGRQIERLDFLSDALALCFRHRLHKRDDGFNLVLGLFESTNTYRAKFQARREVPPLLHLLVQDMDNPRGLAWVARTMRDRFLKLARHDAAWAGEAVRSLPHPGRLVAGAAQRTGRQWPACGTGSCTAGLQRAGAGAVGRARPAPVFARGQGRPHGVAMNRPVEADAMAQPAAPAAAPTLATTDAAASEAGRRWLRVRHDTDYRYRSPVELAHHVAHLCPRDTVHQRVRGWTLVIDPPPDEWAPQHRALFRHHGAAAGTPPAWWGHPDEPLVLQTDGPLPGAVQHGPLGQPPCGLQPRPGA